MVVAFGQPASVSKVVAVIQDSSEGVSQHQIIATTGLSERAVKYALGFLKSLGIINEIFLLNDMRKRLYAIRRAGK